MKTFNDYNNQGKIDNWHNYLGNTDIKDMLVFLGRNRDSGLLDNSNFEVALNSLGGESDNIQIHRFGHWACGWFELILINPKAEDIIKQCEDMLNALSDYPVLNDEDYYKREYESTLENIKDSAKFNAHIDLDDNQLYQVYSWFENNNQRAIESLDDNGGYPDDNEIITALKALNLYTEDC